jgi:hypothetical protein
MRGVTRLLSTSGSPLDCMGYSTSQFLNIPNALLTNEPTLAVVHQDDIFLRFALGLNHSEKLPR